MKKTIPFLLAVLSLNAIEEQTYSPDHYPKISNTAAQFTLDDGSEWIIGPLKGDGSKILIQWDDAKKKYFFKNAGQTIFVEMKKAPNITITGLTDDELTLSNGMKFKHIPFKGPVHLNGRVLLSLNENPKGKEYPYFIVEYKENPQSKEEPWTIVGEVQGHLLKE